MNRRAVGSDGRPGVDEKFSRRPASAAVMALAMFVMALVVWAALISPSSHPVAAIEAPPATASPTTAPPETRPPITANEFLPEEQDLTSCVGALERPGCGSESRGGTGQTLVFVALFFGLSIVFGNIARGVTKNRRAQDN